MLMCGKFDGPLVWHNWSALLQDAQTGQTSHPPNPGAPRRALPRARPQRMTKAEVKVESMKACWRFEVGGWKPWSMSLPQTSFL